MTKTKTATSAATSTTPATKTARRRVSRKAPPITPVAAVAAPPPRVSKRDQLAALLLRDEGATLDQMIAVTGWLPHTTRAAMTGLRKSGYVIDSDKIDGVRTYRAVAPK